MPRPSITLVPVKRLKLHEKLPLTSLEVQPPVCIGSHMLIATPILVDRATDRVVGGLVGLASAVKALDTGPRGVRMILIHVDDAVDHFETDWPLLEARISRLSTTASQNLLIELLVSGAPCVARDHGRAVASMLGFTPRRLKRIRARVAERRKLDMTDPRGSSTSSARKKKRTQIRSGSLMASPAHPSAIDTGTATPPDPVAARETAQSEAPSCITPATAATITASDVAPEIGVEPLDCALPHGPSVEVALLAQTPGGA